MEPRRFPDKCTRNRKKGREGKRMGKRKQATTRFKNKPIYSPISPSLFEVSRGRKSTNTTRETPREFRMSLIWKSNWALATQWKRDIFSKGTSLRSLFFVLRFLLPCHPLTYAVLFFIFSGNSCSRHYEWNAGKGRALCMQIAQRGIYSETLPIWNLESLENARHCRRVVQTSGESRISGFSLSSSLRYDAWYCSIACHSQHVVSKRTYLTTKPTSFKRFDKIASLVLVPGWRLSPFYFMSTIFFGIQWTHQKLRTSGIRWNTSTPYQK